METAKVAVTVFKINAAYLFIFTKHVVGLLKTDQI